MNKKYRFCMTIAGSDPSGGAGIQADLKTFTLLGCYGQAVTTALTIQNTLGVRGSLSIDADWVYSQAACVMEDCMPDAVKIGMIPNAEIAHQTACLLMEYKPRFVVYDPVMISTSGLKLMDDGSIETLRSELLSCCTLVTPNLLEAQMLAGRTDLCPEELAECLYHTLKGPAVLVKGGHREGAPTDVLYDGELHKYESHRVETSNSHGTGCVLSSAIAAYCAKGKSMSVAVKCAKVFLTKALERGADYWAGHGSGSMYLLPVE